MIALQASSSLTALADPTRQRIVEMLATGALSSGEIAGRFELSPPAISQHLKSLKQAGLVAERAQGRNVYYHAKPDGLAPLADWMDHYGVFWRERFANLRSLLKEIDP